MDDHGNNNALRTNAGAVVALLAVLAVILIGGYFYDVSLQNREAGALAREVNSINGLMRHNFKITNLNHRAYHAYLLAVMKADSEQMAQAKKMLLASLGFMNVGYIDARPLRKRVAPLITSAQSIIASQTFPVDDAQLELVRNSFQQIFLALSDLEREGYQNLQQHYAEQLDEDDRRRNVYRLLAIGAVFCMIVIALLAARQMQLIRSLRRSEKKLRRNIAERKLAEEEKMQLLDQLHQAKKMESIGLMAGGVAHDLNNVLAGIVGYPDLLLMNIAEGNELRKPITAIRDSGKRAADIVDDLLTVARGVAVAKQGCSIDKLAAEYMESPEVLKLVKLYNDISFELHTHSENTLVYCSPVHVRKCILNLLTNGAEAVTGKGRVTLSTEKIHGEKAAVGCPELDWQSNYVLLTVEDTGSGINPEDAKHIFDPFYSKKVMGRSGTGLGLTVVWNTMQDHRGHVVVRDTGNGTAFELYFPVTGEAVLVDESLQPTGPPEGQGELVLVVDDESTLRDMCAQMLLTLGYEVATAESGEEAVRMCLEKRYDLVILDMLMQPGAMNGYQTYERIIETLPDQKAIVASGYSESKEVRKAIQLGAHAFVKKPYSLDQFGWAVRKALHNDNGPTKNVRQKK